MEVTAWPGTIISYFPLWHSQISIAQLPPISFIVLSPDVSITSVSTKLYKAVFPLPVSSTKVEGVALNKVWSVMAFSRKAQNKEGVVA